MKKAFGNVMKTLATERPQTDRNELAAHLVEMNKSTGVENNDGNGSAELEQTKGVLEP